MKIRLAENNDKNGLYALWQKTFNDSIETIDLFFSFCYKNENTLIIEDGTSVVAMLYLIPSQIVIDNKEYSSYYVYAAATDEKYRSKGLMTQLLDYCDKELTKRKADFVFLKPASDYLYNYYGKRGFETRLYSYKIRLSATEIKTLEFNGFNYVNWDNNVKSLERKYFEDVTNTSFRNGYARVFDCDSIVTVKNIATDNLDGLIKEIFENKKADYYELELPVGSVDKSNGVEFRTGMIKSLNRVSLNDDTKIYLGISLE